MKFKLSFLILLQILCTTISAQNNVNVDNLRFSYKQRLMPKKTQNRPLFYYGVEVKAPTTVWDYMDDETLYDKIYISGQKKTNNPFVYDYIARLELEPVNIVRSEIKKRQTGSSDKDKKAKKATSYYWIEIDYNSEAKGYMMKDNREISKYSIVNRRYIFTYQSSEYSSRKAAKEFLDNNMDLLLEQFTRECVMSVPESFSNSLTSDFGFPIVTKSTLIKTINEKKHPENDALRAASNQLKSIMEGLDGTVAPTEAEMSDLIEYFKNIPIRYTDLKLKADIRLRYVAYYNLCRIYIFLDQPEKVKEYADLLFENGHDKKDAERLTKDAQKLQEYLANAYIKASQFSTDSYFDDQE